MTYQEQLRAFNEWAFWNDLPAMIGVCLIIGSAIAVVVWVNNWSDNYLNELENRPLEEDDVLS